VPLLFAVTLFVSAALLFLIQLLVAKMILPLLGGMPAVWITCLLFFQAVLLAGYTYAHAVGRRLATRRQALAHLGLLVVPVLALPLLTLPLQLLRGEAPAAGPATWIGLPPNDASPIPWLLGLLVLTVGLPFFALSTTAPLLQRWFARTGHPSASDPYFLYAASNLGSMLALLGYPVVLEPSLGLAEQSGVWIAGYILLIVLVATCAFAVWRSPIETLVNTPAKNPGDKHLHLSAVEKRGDKRPRVAPEKPSDQTAGALNPGYRLRWLALAFVPSGLLFGVTTYLSTDLAAVPLLWVIPLALYLLTFILVFARRTLVPHRFVVLILPVLILLQLGQVLGHLVEPKWPAMLLHLLLFFAAALFCHGELARSRPPVEHLTEFYLWMSLGGVLGGLFNVLIAPLVFNMVAEYPLEIALACLFVPHLAGARKPRDPVVNLGVPLVAGIVAAVLLALLPSWRETTWFRTGLLLVPAVLVYLVGARFTNRPLLFGLGVELILLGAVMGLSPEGEVLYRERSFFGVVRVTRDPDRQYIQLFHGGTSHGKQRISNDPEERNTPRTYYHPTGPIGQVFAAFSGEQAKRQVALVGLGPGSLAHYGEHGQEMTFYEIDPAVVWIAQDSGRFSFLRESKATINIVLGDGRLALAREPDGKFGLIVLDAFSSDAIPVHLLTREALRDVYLRKLADDGLLAFHISNRYLDLQPVLGDLAADLGLVCRGEVDPGDERVGKADSVWVIMARKEADLGPLAHDARWQRLAGRPGERVWRDDYSNLLRVFRWKAAPERPR
jgi:hypothetical protein